MTSRSFSPPVRVISFTLNGAPFSVKGAPDTRLIHILRNDAALNGPKFGCGFGQCGACAVLIDGMVARSCVMTLAAAEGRQVITLEGLKDGDEPGLIQRSFIEGQGAQCGYCLNGMVITAQALLRKQPDPSRATIAEALRYTLCRCGTHLEIIRSIELAKERLAAGETL